MSQDRDALIRERIELQNAYRDYVARNGFDYSEYVSPPPDSFFDRYRRRVAEINAVIAPALRYSSEIEAEKSLDG